MKGNGIDVTVAEFARELSKYHNVQLAAVRSDIEVPGVELVHYPANRISKMRSVAKEIDRQKFDFISTHYLPFDMVATMCKTPHLLHDHGIAPFTSLLNNRKELALSFEVNAFRMISARKAAMVLPISSYIGRGFRRKYLYGGRMEVLPSGIEFPGSDPAPVSGEYGKYILYVGRHTPYKGVDKLIRIFGEVKEEVGDGVHLVTLGKIDKDYDAYLKALASKVGNVHMLGYIPDIWPYYAGAEVYATCSAWEGEDRPVIEAQYMGKPAVTFNNCSHPEVVFYGSLASNGKEFKEALIKHLTDRKVDMTVRQKVVERFSTRSTIKKYVEVARNMSLK